MMLFRSISSRGRSNLEADPIGRLPMNRMTDTCKSITLPQASFAGSNDWDRLQQTSFEDVAIV